MISSNPPTQESLRQTAEVFWESLLPFWHQIRAHIRTVAVEQFDISVEQFHILRHIRKGHGSVSELAEEKRISRPAISQAVDALVNKGLIRRTPGEKDRRHVQLDLTTDGNALLDGIFDNTNRWMMEVLGRFSEDELQSILTAMSLLKKTATG